MMNTNTSTHFKLHASKIKQKTQHPCHPLHKLPKKTNTKTYETNHFQQHNKPKHRDYDRHLCKQENNSFSHCHKTPQQKKLQHNTASASIQHL